MNTSGSRSWIACVVLGLMALGNAAVGAGGGVPILGAAIVGVITIAILCIGPLLLIAVSHQRKR